MSQPLATPQSQGTKPVGLEELDDIEQVVQGFDIQDLQSPSSPSSPTSGQQQQQWRYFAVREGLQGIKRIIGTRLAGGKEILVTRSRSTTSVASVTIAAATDESEAVVAVVGSMTREHVHFEEEVLSDVEEVFSDADEDVDTDRQSAKQSLRGLEHALMASIAKTGPKQETGRLFDGGILTSANQKKWYHTALPVNWIQKLSSEYHFGNYVITDRETGTKVWEDMPIYARIGMHLLFAGMFDRKVAKTHRIQHLFSVESVNQGRNFDAPESVAQIPHFIKTYKLNLSELLEPDLSKYSSFNQFFYRKLRPDARPIHQKANPVTVIGLDPVVHGEGGANEGGGVGEEVVERCVFVSIGALLVGSIELTGAKDAGTRLEKGDELGYFAYGGSTCILLFQPGSVRFDEDLVATSLKGLETLVKMGERIGERAGPVAPPS
ncbi:hypothetical protein KI688_006532 [Linnemannia hyalina]|uniref:Phosphatidylserine decarboxylase n=1 Tax=Linnemannia hyalina TaxID=64524 RepID=A0A9P8BNG2_9FUNG|nr:hypothetical protein KI688_006532 [Linnemannia hyalina]